LTQSYMGGFPWALMYDKKHLDLYQGFS
jgi:hypothetical protein